MDITLASGARTLSRGLRTANPALAALGAAMLAILVVRASEPRQRVLMHRSTMRSGESLQIAVSADQPTRYTSTRAVPRRPRRRPST